MTRFPCLRGFLRTLVGLNDRSGSFWGVDRAPLNWSNAKTSPIRDVLLMGAELMRAAGDRNAPPWCCDLPAPWSSR